MKNITIKLILLGFITSMINCKSQIIVDISSDAVLPSNYDETGQYYEKDVHNYLDNFTGTWEYINGNEKFQIILTKMIKYHNVNSKFNINIYKDGITLKYKKFANNNLTFESPSYSYPNFRTENGQKLEGFFTDYERLTRTVHYPQGAGGGVLKQGGEYFHPSCTIELQPLTLNSPPKIKFTLDIGETVGEYRNPAYSGMPTFSIPNDVVMTKVP
ncbi:DUF6705 family protein [Chryseobacterium aquaticum]|nr:DUF6705 family protein [Chryseobacterium aquaticum]